MKKISELKNILVEKLNWNKARVDCFTLMLLALFAVRTVNLSEIAVGMSSKAQMASRYKRLQRFFKSFSINYLAIAKFIFGLFFSDQNKKFYLTIDRTNWFWGKSKINILTLAIAYEGVAIPIFWTLLDKAGNATAQEHQAIIERFVNLFGKGRIEGVLGDREFASGELFSWLNKQEIPFCIRIKEGSQVKIQGKKFRKAAKLFNHLNPKEKSVFQMNITLFGTLVYLAGSRSERGELMIVATNKNPKNAIASYLRRWEIETLFSCLKGRGFRFEETHLTKLDRIEKMMALLAVAFCWAHKTGEWRATIKPIFLKKHRESFRPQNSFFRYGFDFIREIILSHFNKSSAFKASLKAFISPISLTTSPPILAQEGIS
jgi:hypothetical protein